MISISEVCVFIHSKCTCTYPVKRGFPDSVHVCGSQQFPQLFVGDVYGTSELIEKIGVEVDTTLKVTGKAFDPSLYCLLNDHNIVRGELSYNSPANQWKLVLETIYLSLYMDRSEFNNNYLNDGRICNASHLEPKLY